MSGVGQTRQELEAHLREQVAFLCRSAAAFDQGFEDEAKRMAIVLRIMFHDTSSSHSLLGQLGALQGLQVYDTATPIDPANLLSTDGLTATRIMAGGGNLGTAQSVAVLDNGSPAHARCRRVWDDWWTRPVIKDGHGQEFSRRSLVLGVTNKDGGAHVDPSLDEAYAHLTRENSMGWTLTDMTGTETAGPPPHLASLRQIAHEVLSTLAAFHPSAFEDTSCREAHQKIDVAALPECTG